MAMTKIEVRLNSEPCHAARAKLERILESSPELWPDLEEIDEWFSLKQSPAALRRGEMVFDLVPTSSLREFLSKHICKEI